MNPRRKPKRISTSRAPLLLAAAFALLAAMAGLAAARPADRDPASLSTPAPIVVGEDDTVVLPTPSRPVAKGERLGDVPLVEVRWPKSRVTGAYAEAASQLRDSYAITPLPASLPVPTSSISRTPIDANAVAEAIPEGMRAITVRVDAESSVEGWARTGNSVDVILVRAARDPGAGLESLVVAERVKILSAGSSIVPVGGGETAPRAPSTITLLTTQEDALKIKTAANLGKLTFALRGIGDSAATTTTSVDQRRVLGAPAMAVVPAAARLRGKAKGPDGRTYVLSDDSGWSQATGTVAAISGASPAQSQLASGKPGAVQ